MGVISDSGLKVSSVRGFSDDVDSVIESKANGHVTKGENVWSDVSTAHSSRFNTLEGKDMTVGDEATPVG